MDEVTIHSVVGIGTKVVMRKKIKKEEQEDLKKSTYKQEIPYIQGDLEKDQEDKTYKQENHEITHA